MAYRKMSANGYTRDQLHFRREHSGAPPQSIAPLRPLWPFAVAAIFMMLVGCQIIIKSMNAPMALLGFVVCMGGLGIIWFIGHQVAARHD